MDFILKMMDRTTYEGEDVVPMRGWWGCEKGVGRIGLDLQKRAIRAA